jgi:hypothetical protein
MGVQARFAVKTLRLYFRSRKFRHEVCFGGADVRYWHLADIRRSPFNVRFRSNSAHAFLHPPSEALSFDSLVIAIATRSRHCEAIGHADGGR